MLKNICRNTLITLLNDVGRVAEGKEVSEVGPEQWLSFQKYITEAKRRFTVLQKGVHEEVIAEDLFLGFSVSDRHIGARLLDVIEEALPKCLLPTTAHVLIQLDVWGQNPQKDAVIEKVLHELWRINYDTPDSSPSAMKSIVSN